MGTKKSILESKSSLFTESPLLNWKQSQNKACSLNKFTNTFDVRFKTKCSLKSFIKSIVLIILFHAFKLFYKE